MAEQDCVEEFEELSNLVSFPAFIANFVRHYLCIAVCKKVIKRRHYTISCLNTSSLVFLSTMSQHPFLYPHTVLQKPNPT